MTPSRLAPLRNVPFRRLAGAYTVNEFGNWLGEVALAVLVFDRTNSPLAVTALFLAWNLVPAFAAPALTARLDQLAVRWALSALYALEAVAFVVLAALTGAFSLPAILALALLDGTLAVTGRALLGPRWPRCWSATACCARATRSSTSASPRQRPRARRSAASWWRGWASHRRCCSTPRPSRSSRRCWRPRAGCPRPGPSASPGWRGPGPASAMHGTIAPCAPFCAVRRRRSSSSPRSSRSRSSTRRTRWGPGTAATGCCSPRGGPASSSGASSSRAPPGAR